MRNVPAEETTREDVQSAPLPRRILSQRDMATFAGKVNGISTAGIHCERALVHEHLHRLRHNTSQSSSAVSTRLSKRVHIGRASLYATDTRSRRPSSRRDSGAGCHDIRLQVHGRLTSVQLNTLGCGHGRV